MYTLKDIDAPDATCLIYCSMSSTCEIASHRIVLYRIASININFTIMSHVRVGIGAWWNRPLDVASDLANLVTQPIFGDENNEIYCTNFANAVVVPHKAKLLNKFLRQNAQELSVSFALVTETCVIAM